MTLNNKQYNMKYFLTLSISICFSLASTAQCVKGNCHNGHGTFEWENGGFYEGMWDDGKPHGYGFFIYENDDQYKGKFSEGLRQGNGKYTWKAGNSYDGNWDKDKMNGRGDFHWAKDGGVYKGLFIDGQINNIEIEATLETPEKGS